MAILVTGGTGFIGSHTVVQLLNDGREVVIVDNLCNSKLCVLDRIKAITGKSVKFYKADLLDFDAIDTIFKENKIDSVIHFAGLKAVAESVEQPLRYYENNITGTLNLLEAMQKYGVKKIIFSSSATVYGDPGVTSFSEDLTTGQGITNPYGRTKYMIEEILKEAEFNFKMEYVFPDLKSPSGRPLRFDFVIFDDDGLIDFIIEYQGKQHYEASAKFGGKRGLYQQQYNDNQKRRFCALHDFKLIEIPYTDENLISYDYIMKLAGY